MTSKTKQKRLRKAQQPRAADPMALAPVPRKTPSGKTRVPGDHVSERNADAVALKARARHTGGKIDDMRHPAYGRKAGAAIKALCDDASANELWGLYGELLNAREVYYRVCHGKSPYPKSATLEVLPERIETRADHAPDLRTTEERVRAATTRWMHWQGRLSLLSQCEHRAIRSAWEDDAGLMRDREPTVRGLEFVGAMRALAKVKAGS